MIRYIFILFLFWYGLDLFNQTFIYPLLTKEIPVNQLRFLSNQSISSITIYDGMIAHIKMKISDDNFGVGPILFAKIYLVRTISVEKLFVDITKYYGEIGNDVDIYYRRLSSVTWIELFTFFLMYQLVNGLLLFMFSQKGGKGLFGSMIGGDKKFEIVRNEMTRLKDVAGCSEVKEEVLELIDMMKRGKNYLKFGAKLPKGALLSGPPGTGKTLMAKAIAGECGFSFISVSGSDFNEILVGMGSSRIRKLFKVARKNRPCVVFIDEIDALAHRRSEKFHNNDDKDNTLNSLLVEMDGFESNEGILVLGATNRAEVLDKAIMRAGRFDRKIYFGLPDKNDRSEIFEYYFGKTIWKDIVLKQKALDDIVPISYGLTGADICNILNEAAIKVCKEDRNGVTYDDIMEAFGYVICGKEKKNYFMTDEERKVVAYHECGHALMGWIMKGCSAPVKISMIPTGKSALGYTLRENEEKKLKKLQEMLAEIGMMLGGRLAEEIFVGSITTGASDDFKKAIEQAKSMVIDYNFFVDYYLLNDGAVGGESKRLIDELATKIVRDIYKIGRRYMKEYSKELEEMVIRLGENRKLGKEDISEIFGKNMREIVELSVKDKEGQIEIID